MPRTALLNSVLLTSNLILAVYLRFALNPWAMISSRKIWSPSSLPILTVALPACLLLYQRGKRSQS